MSVCCARSCVTAYQVLLYRGGNFCLFSDALNFGYHYYLFYILVQTPPPPLVLFTSPFFPPLLSHLLICIFVVIFLLPTRIYTTMYQFSYWVILLYCHCSTRSCGMSSSHAHMYTHMYVSRRNHARAHTLIRNFKAERKTKNMSLKKYATVLGFCWVGISACILLCTCLCAYVCRGCACVVVVCAWQSRENIDYFFIYCYCCEQILLYFLFVNCCERCNRLVAVLYEFFY